MRWNELRPSDGSLSVYQQGTYAPDSTYRWMGSIAMDHSGDMALGYSTSSSSLHPGAAYTGRLASDPVGTMPHGETTIFTGAGSQTGGLTRWGDYSEMSVDPADNCTFWYVNEYLPANGSFNWQTRIGSFKFPSCGAGRRRPSLPVPQAAWNDDGDRRWNRQSEWPVDHVPLRIRDLDELGLAGTRATGPERRLGNDEPNRVNRSVPCRPERLSLQGRSNQCVRHDVRIGPDVHDLNVFA